MARVTSGTLRSVIEYWRPVTFSDSETGVGSYQCAGAGVCVDIDECSDADDKSAAAAAAVSGRRCGDVGQCVNTAGGYRCSCPRGYVSPQQDPSSSSSIQGSSASSSSSQQCRDVDECADEQMCQYGCINLPGGYRCECPVGFIQHIYWNQCIGQSHSSTSSSSSSLLPVAATRASRKIGDIPHSSGTF